MKNRYFIFGIILVISGIYLSLLPNSFIIAPDTQSYTLSQSLIRPIGYSLFLKLNFRFVIFIQAIMCATIFQAIYSVFKSKTLIIILLLTGAYIVYTPYLLPDMSFSFFIVLAFYFAYNKKFYPHILMLGVASLLKPTLAYFFVVEPVIIWFMFKDKKLVVLSFVLCFVVTSFMPVKNYVEFGRFVHSDILNLSRREYYYSEVNNKLLYMVYSLFSNHTSTHWNYLLAVFGYQKGVSKELWFNLINWTFSCAYIIIWIRFLISSVIDKTWYKLVWVGYFVAPTIFCHAGGGRWRLPFEFLLF